jgi:YD repeat-containing protein
MSYGYDLAGNITRQVYSFGKEVRTIYDSAGRLSSVSHVYWRSVRQVLCQRIALYTFWLNHSD